jgi:hypothetical protein
MNEFKRYEVAGLRLEFSPNGSPLTGVLSTAGEDVGPYVAELDLAKPRSRKSYAEDAGEICGMDAERIAFALNELCVLRLAEVQQAREATGENGSVRDARGEYAPDGAELLEQLARFIRRYVALSEDQALLIALWIVHTHALEAADTTPYLNIKSAEKRSGKTRLLEVLSLLAAGSWLTGRVTPAVLVRKVAAETPALLLDESDAAFKGDREYAETLRGVLNAGFRRGGVASLCVGQGAGLTYEDFPVYCPKAIAGIGRLPDTVADRAIPIELRRRRASERVERFRLRKVGPEALPLREAASAWAEAYLAALCEAEPDLPDELDDRAQDIMEPLFAIADEVAAEWPERSRRAAVALLTGEEREDSDSLGVRLLRDIRDVFNNDDDADRLPTGQLLEALHKMEEAPWGSLRGEALDARGLARLLKPYGVKPEKLREGVDTFRGYRRTLFEDAWARYVPDTSEEGSPEETGEESATPGEAEQAEQPEHPADRAGSGVPHKQNVPEHDGYVEHEKPHKKGDVPHVPLVPHNPVPVSFDLRAGESAAVADLRERREVVSSLRRLFEARPEARKQVPEQVASDLFVWTDLGYEPSVEAVKAALEELAPDRDSSSGRRDSWKNDPMRHYAAFGDRS